MATWIRGPDDVQWHACRVHASGTRSTRCGLAVGPYALDRPPGDLPAHWERCLTCYVRLITEARRGRLKQILRADELETALRRYRDH